MADFRTAIPKKRNPAPVAVTTYREFKKDLREDYNGRCGYCNDPDAWTGGWRFYQLDHFVPKKLLVKIKVDDYDNLVYSCFFCNNAKRAKWPTKDETKHHENGKGFIHPTEAEYNVHLKRESDGRIVSDTVLGKYMIKAMKLDLARHAIIWNLDRVELLLDQINDEQEKARGKISVELYEKMHKQYHTYLKYIKLLKKAVSE